MKNHLYPSFTVMVVAVAAGLVGAIGIPRGVLTDSIIDETCSQQYPDNPAQFRSCQELLSDVEQGRKKAYELYKTIVTPLLDTLTPYLRRPEIFSYFPEHSFEFDDVVAKVKRARRSLKSPIDFYQTQSYLDDIQYLLSIGSSYDMFQYLLTRKVPKVTVDELRAECGGSPADLRDRSVYDRLTDAQIYCAFESLICFARGSKDYARFLDLMKGDNELLVHYELCGFRTTPTMERDSLLVNHVFPLLNTCGPRERRLVTEWRYRGVVRQTYFYISANYRMLTRDSVHTDSTQLERSRRFLQSEEVLQFLDIYQEAILSHSPESETAPRCIAYIRSLSEVKGRKKDSK